MSRPAAIALSALAALASRASAIVTLEVYYGPYCPNSANYLSMSVQPLLYANLPDLAVTMMPYAVDPTTHALPQPCPTADNASPCGVLAAPMCALKPFFASMPAPVTPAYTSAMNFAICDLIHANHGKPAGMTHTPADIQACAAQNQVNYGEIAACMPNAAAAPEYGVYTQKILAADSKLPPGMMAPFIFVNGQFVDNTVPLLQHICQVMGMPPACQQALAPGRLYDEDVGKVASRGVPTAVMISCVASAALLAAAAVVLVRSAKKSQNNEAERNLVLKANDSEQDA